MLICSIRLLLLRHPQTFFLEPKGGSCLGTFLLLELPDTNNCLFASLPLQTFFLEPKVADRMKLDGVVTLVRFCCALCCYKLYCAFEPSLALLMDCMKLDGVVTLVRLVGYVCEAGGLQ